MSNLPKSIRLDEKTKKYYVVYRYKDYTGKIKQTTKRGFETHDLALKFYYNVKLENMDISKVKIKFKDLYNLFIDDCQMRLKYSTIESYNYKYNKYLEVYSNYDINKITKIDLNNYIKKLYNSKSFSLLQINKVITLLKKIYLFGNAKLNINYNPTLYLEKIRISNVEKHVDFYTLKEFNNFILVIPENDYMYKVIFMVLFWCGLRCGELQALNVADVDFKNNVIHVTKNYMRKPKGKYEIVDCKTKASLSCVHIPKVLKDELANYIKFNNLKKNDYLFSNNNERIKKRTIENHNIKYSKNANLKTIRIHDFRHSFASLVYELSNYNYEEVARRMRHANVSTIMKTYIHVFPNRKNEVDNKLDSL